MYLTISIFGFFIIIACILLILIILIQNPNKDSISQSFLDNNFKFLGVKRTNSFLEGVTWFLSIVIFFLTIVFNIFLKLKQQ
ncbi:preprotein translocase subunit SecG [Blattabacterium cuenoti]|uniref:preprotein translocase subunit SecG n=1 Tax=Blattabacterium cuenoti TaxID=1653831 RepID=UPI00163C3E8E|nr:preprotein translocase subunit SecG [Blattabacterium cuenoti]